MSKPPEDFLAVLNTRSQDIFKKIVQRYLDTGMPVGLTFAGRAYDDSAVLRFAAAFESTGSKRLVPPRTPPLLRG